MKTLTKVLREKQKAQEMIIVPYLMAGAQGLSHLVEEIQLLSDAGASAIEIGIPFSDPVADGPIIQQAGLKALKDEVTLKDILQELKKVQTKTPLVIMTYFNPIFAFGLEEFIQQLADTSVKGLIIPDLPYEHREFLVPLLQKTDICLIPLVALTTPKERVRVLVEQGEGFIYAVSVNGVTGIGRDYQDSLDEHLQYIQSVSPYPVLVGFGVSTLAHVKRFKENCAGVVVGSKIVQLFDEGKTDEVATFIQSVVR